MTRKDYVALANELGERYASMCDRAPDSIVRETLQDEFWRIVTGICRVLSADNSNFRKDQFLDAIAYRASTGKLVRVGQTRFDR